MRGAVEKDVICRASTTWLSANLNDLTPLDYHVWGVLLRKVSFVVPVLHGCQRILTILPPWIIMYEGCC